MHRRDEIHWPKQIDTLTIPQKKSLVLFSQSCLLTAEQEPSQD